MCSLMTMNPGYCLSTLSGIVLGNFAVRIYSDKSLSRRTIGFVVIVAAVIVADDLY